MDTIQGINELEYKGQRPQFRVQDGKLVFRFACPRCGTLQDIVVDPEDLISNFGLDFECQNQPGCGPSRNMSFSLTMAINGAYNTYADDPYKTHEPMLLADPAS